MWVGQRASGTHILGQQLDWAPECGPGEERGLWSWATDTHTSPCASQAKVTEECSQYEFENYMRQQLLLAEEKSSIHEARSWVPKRQFGSVPPVRRLGHDAQPMNPLDAAILAQRYLRK